MDRIKVELLEISGLQSAIKAVGMPYKKEGTLELLQKVAKVLRHESALEHMIMSWQIDGSSRLELQEHMRHRMASPTVTSTRYTLKKHVTEFLALNENFMVHGVDHAKLKSFIDEHHCLPMILKKQQVYLAMYDSILECANTYQAHGADVAKYILHESFRTSFVWTINLRSMLNFLELRTAKNAHLEIRLIANQMKSILERTEIASLL